jgi:ABC-type Fe3+/spermidine/putrescine transport system ATPase subunit
MKELLLYQGPTRELYDSPASAFLAEFLGPVNWLTAEELQHFGMIASISPTEWRFDQNA